MGDSDTLGVLLMSIYSIISFWLLSLPKVYFPKIGCWKWKQTFQCFCSNSGYSTLTLTQNIMEISGCLKHTFMYTQHFMPQAVDPLLAETKSAIHLAYSQMSHGSIPSRFRGLLWLGNNAQTLESWHGWLCTSWRKEGPDSVSFKPLLMFETSKSQCSWVAPVIPVGLLKAASLPAYFNTVVILLRSDRWSSLSRLSMSYKKAVLWPILWHWNVLAVVTVFL